MILYVRFFTSYLAAISSLAFSSSFFWKIAKNVVCKGFSPKFRSEDANLCVPWQGDLAIHNHFHYVIVLIYIFSTSLTSSMTHVRKDK